MRLGTNGHNGNKTNHQNPPVIYLPDGRPAATTSLGVTPEARDLGGGAEGSRALDFMALPDGTLLDLVCPQRGAAPKLVVWREGRISISGSYESRGERYIPPALPPELLNAVRLPQNPKPDGGVQHLLGDLGKVIAEQVHLSTSALILLSCFVLCTWLLERVPVAPVLWLIGTPESATLRLLRVLECLCRRSILLEAVSLAGVRRLVRQIRPTLLIADADGAAISARDRQKLVHGGSKRGVYFATGNGFGDSFCPKVLCARSPIIGSSTRGHSLVLRLPPVAQERQLLRDATLEEIAAEFQPRLLHYRLENYVAMGSHQVPDLTKFSPGMQELIFSLAAPLRGAEAPTAELFSALLEQAEIAEVDRSIEPEWIVAKALYHLAHKPWNNFTVGTFNAEFVARVLAEFGEPFGYSDRKVGSILSTLDFKRRKLGSRGFGLDLTDEVRRKIHGLARDFGLTKADLFDSGTVDLGYAGAPCRFCKDFGLLVRPDGTPLKEFVPPEDRELRRRRLLGPTRRAGSRKSMKEGEHVNM